MLTWLKKTLKKNLNINITFDRSRLKWYECLLIIYFIFLYLFVNGYVPQWFINTIAPDRKEFDNIFNLFFLFNKFGISNLVNFYNDNIYKLLSIFYKLLSIFYKLLPNFDNLWYSTLKKINYICYVIFYE